MPGMFVSGAWGLPEGRKARFLQLLCGPWPEVCCTCRSEDCRDRAPVPFSCALFHLVEILRFIGVRFRVKAVHSQNVGYLPPVVRCLFHEDNQINRPANQLLFGAKARFLDQFFHTGQRFFRAVRVKGAYPARMPGVPQFKKFQGGGVPHLTYQDAFRSLAHTGFRQFPHINVRDHGSTEKHSVGAFGLKFRRILYDDQSVRGCELGDSVNNRVDESCFSAGGSADHYNVPAPQHSVMDDFNDSRHDGAGSQIFLEGKSLLSG